MSHRRVLGSVVAAVLALGVAIPLTTMRASGQTSAPPTGPPLPPTSVKATDRGDHSVDVSWTLAPTGPQADYVWVFEFTGAGQPVRLLQANADEPHKRFYVETGQWLFFVSTVNSAGNSPYTAGPVVDVPVGCSSADVCLTVDEAPTPAPNELKAAGFLNSTSAWGQSLDPALTSALRPSAWRVADAGQLATVSQYTNSRTLMLSELWFAATSPSSGGYAAMPWDDWNNYRSWVSATVTSAKADGWAPEYWDLANEPDLMSNPANGYFAPSISSKATPDNLLQMMLVAYQAIKAADPTAKIVGPSMAEYQDSVQAPPDRPNVRTFLQFAAANNMVLDAITWHEDNEQSSSYDATVLPVIVTEHVERLGRQLAKYPSLGRPPAIINEYAHDSTNMLPGWNAGFMGEIDRAPLGQANRTCWATQCTTPSLDGLLTQTGSTYTGTTASYWTYRAYADMAGATNMDVKSSTAWRFSGTAVRDDASRTVRVLAGAHAGCAPSVNPSCTNSYDPGAMTASVDIPYSYGPTATVAVYKLPAGVGPISGPTLLSSATATVVGGRLVVPLSGISDGDAISIVISPAA